jgi:hypothetical protein
MTISKTVGAILRADVRELWFDSTAWTNGESMCEVGAFMALDIRGF